VTDKSSKQKYNLHINYI